MRASLHLERIEGGGLRYTTVRLLPFVSLDGWACRVVPGGLATSRHDQLGRNPHAYPSRPGCACWSDLLAPRGTIIDSGLGPAKGPACDCCSIWGLLAPVS
jgi:hypothetical protein